MTLPALAKLNRTLLALLLAIATTTAVAQEDAHQAAPQEQRQGAPQERRGQPQATADQGVLRLLPADAVSHGLLDTSNGKLDYTATAGTLSLFDQSGQRSAAIFYTAYVLNDADAARRPLTFVFNGGPGAASAFLNLGLVGPRIAEFGPANRDASATRLANNPDSWLPLTDLVLIDPVGSGWSRPAKADGGSAFWGVRRDADSMAKTIALYGSKNARSASASFSLLNMPLRSSSEAASEGNCSAAPKAKRVPPKVNAPSSSGDTITMPEMMMPCSRCSARATLAARKPP